MKRLVNLFVFGCLFSITALAASPVNPPSSDDYFIDDQKVEQLFANSVDISLSSLGESLLPNNSSKNGFAASNAFYAPGEKTFVAALLLNFF